MMLVAVVLLSVVSFVSAAVVTTDTFGDVGAQFDIDFVEVFVRDAPVPIDDPTWGRIKAKRR